MGKILTNGSAPSSGTHGSIRIGYLDDDERQALAEIEQGTTPSDDIDRANVSVATEFYRWAESILKFIKAKRIGIEGDEIWAYEDDKYVIKKFVGD